MKLTHGWSADTVSRLMQPWIWILVPMLLPPPPIPAIVMSYLQAKHRTASAFRPLVPVRLHTVNSPLIVIFIQPVSDFIDGYLLCSLLRIRELTMVQTNFPKTAHKQSAAKHAPKHAKHPTSKLRLTHNQAMVYHTLLNFDRAAKAYELLDTLRPQGVNTPPTIYRALSELESKNLVRTIHCTRSFTARPMDQPFTKNSILIVCEACGHVETFESQSLQHTLSQSAHNAGFSPREKIVEILALCPEEICPISKPERTDG